VYDDELSGSIDDRKYLDHLSNRHSEKLWWKDLVG
jgi:hypothetical protein